MEKNRTCPCGSGKERWEEFDARGISIGYVCEDCIEKKKAKYRSEIFSDPNYACDEQVESDY